MLDRGLDKATWLDLIRSGRAEWDALLQEVGKDRMAIPGVVGDWSVKDLLAHVTFWEGSATRHLEAAIRGEPTSPTPYTGLDFEEVNQLVYRENKDRTVDDLLEWSISTHRRMVGAIEALSEEQLGEPGRFPWLEGSPLWEAVSGNSYDHYPEHIASIRSWLEGR